MYSGSFLQFLLNPRAYNKTPQGKSKHSKWAKKIYKKYNFECDNYSYRAGGNMALEAHHMDSKYYFPRKAYDTSNGVCLCEKCHSSFHKSMGGTRVKCTKKDYIMWRNKSKKRNSYFTLYVIVFIIFFMMLWISNV